MLGEAECMGDVGALLRNKSNNFGRPCNELLRNAADVIEALQHRVRYGKWQTPLDRLADLDEECGLQ
jgi:hypothetical protein